MTRSTALRATAPAVAAPSRRDALLLIAVCALAAVVYLNSLGNGFAFDDVQIIQDNPRVHGIENIAAAVTGPYWSGVPSHEGLYRPLALATFAIDWEIGGGHPFPFHLTNVALHVLVTALLFLVIRGMGAGATAAAAGAAVFAVHPVHVEAVANVVGRAELLMTLFFLAACATYARMATGWKKAAVVAALYLLSLLAKENGVTLPGALVLIELARAPSMRNAFSAARAEWRVYGALVLALVAYFGLRWATLGVFIGSSAAPWFWGEPGSTRFWTAVRVIPEYLRLMLLPVDLVPDYGPAVITPETSPGSPLVLLGIAMAALAALVVVLAWARARLVAVGVLWFAGTVLPVSGLLISTGFPLAERTLYLPSAGLAVALAGIAPAIRARGPAAVRLAAAALAVLLLAGAARTWIQNPVWRDTGSVMAHLAATEPTNFRILWLEAASLRAEGRRPEAVRRLETALAMVPGSYGLRLEYGNELFLDGRYAAAAAQFDTARHIAPHRRRAHLFYVQSALLAGRNQEAAAAALPIMQRFGENKLLHHLRAQALARMGRWPEAIQARQASIRLDQAETLWAQWLNLAALNLAAGNDSAAAPAVQRARAHAPDTVRVPSVSELQRSLDRGETTGIPLW